MPFYSRLTGSPERKPVVITVESPHQANFCDYKEFTAKQLNAFSDFERNQVFRAFFLQTRKIVMSLLINKLVTILFLFFFCFVFKGFMMSNIN